MWARLLVAVFMTVVSFFIIPALTRVVSGWMG